MGLVFGIIIGQIVCISLGEWMLWKLFLRRRIGMEFPREVDDSPFRFLTNERMGFYVCCHTIFLFTCTSVATLFLW